MIAYIKDSLRIGGTTKALLKLQKGDVKEDRITTANSSFTAYSIDDNVAEGDYIVLKNKKGKTMYKGVITSFKGNVITTKQMQGAYSGTFIYSIVDNFSSVRYIEEQVKEVLNHYSQGKLYGSSYDDPLISGKLSSIDLQFVNSISGLLPSDKDEDGNEQYTSKDMEKWLYELYDTYGIVCDFDIPTQEGTPTLKIWKPNYTGLKIADGFECISNISPTTETQKTNKIVVYWKSEVEGEHRANEYRDTYILTNTGIQREPISIAGRLNVVNTKVIISDDPIDDIVKANLNDTIFNHKLDFEVDLNSNLFSFDDLKLDVPIEVYDGLNYYNTLITGRSFSFDENDNISSLKIIGGKVRNSLTQKLSLGMIK